MQEQAVRGTILNPYPDRHVELIADGVLVSDSGARISFVGAAQEYKGQIPVRRATGIIMPPMLDAHIHIPQWPIRGKFCDGVSDGGNGRLLAGLERNVFPEEARNRDDEYAKNVVEKFRADTLAQGVIGGAAYMTAHASATRIALEHLGESWAVGMVLMDQNCPEYLRTDLGNVARDIENMANDFGRRLLVTDRFAVSVSTELRQRAAQLASRFGLSRQTHLNEQRGEKEFVEKNLYPDANSYTDVYQRDGLFDGPCLCAHCIWMRDQEWSILRDRGCAVAHCPSSNALLGSGIMNLEAVKTRDIPWSICTDVGAGPSTSLLAEMVSFLLVHDGRHATNAEEALWGVTLGAAKVLNLDHRIGQFAGGMDYSYIEVDTFEATSPLSPSPGTPGEGRGEGLQLRTEIGLRTSSDPHPNPLPEYRARGPEAEPFIRHNLLGLTNTAAREDISAILRQLSDEGLEDQPCLEILQTHLAGNVKRLENRVQRVVLKGMETWTR